MPMLTERIETLAAVLSVIRSSREMTQPQLAKQVGLSRGVVTARIAELEAAGLVSYGGMAPSTGGRAPRQLRLRAEAGVVVGVDIGATGMAIGLSDLSGRIVDRVVEPMDIANGPDVVLDRVESLVEQLLARSATTAEIWGIGVGVPGPVEFATGLPVAPPIMPGWNGYSIRERFSRRWSAPTWVDNDVNLLAIGELHTNQDAADARNLLFVKIGTGIGAGLISNGRLHRGSNGCAGDIGHVAVVEAENVICRCGNAGCLEAVAGGAALAREGRQLAESGGSAVMAEMLASSGRLTAEDVATAAWNGDAAARALLARSGRLVGRTLATLVSFYNPGLVVLGGGVVNAGDYVLAAIREVVYQRSLPLATRTLRVEPSATGDTGGLGGAVHLVLDELFAPERLARWLAHATPAGRPDLAGTTDLEPAA